MLGVRRKVRAYKAIAFVGVRKIATHSVRQKKIRQLRSFINELPDPLPFSGPDLVMGCAYDYNIETVRPFVESLFDAGRFRGEAVMFVRPQHQALTAYLKAAGIKVFSLDIQDVYPIGVAKRARYFANFRYLHDRIRSGRSYRNILLSDVRDVIFQKPLFKTPSSELELHYEPQSPNIGQCSINSQWIRDQFGRRALANLAERRISCSGTVSGRVRGILEYLAEMQITLLNLLPTVQMTNGDQGVHNYVLHSGLLRQAKVLENFKRVATLHHVPSEQLHIDDAGHIVNPDGSISEVVHQYDRHPHLFSALQKSFYNVRAERVFAA